MKHRRLITVVTLLILALGVSLPTPTNTHAVTSSTSYEWFWRPPPYVYPPYGGSSFEPSPQYVVRDPIHPNTVYVVTIACSSADCSYFYTPPGGIYKSPDSGLTWQYMGMADPEPPTALLVDPVTPNILFEAFQQNTPSNIAGIYRSTDGGATWTSVISHEWIMDVEFDPTDHNILYAVGGPEGGIGTPGGVYQSTDNGKTWTVISSELFSAIAVNPATPNVLYGTLNGGFGTDRLYRSDDSGRTWTSIPYPPQTAAGTRLLFDPKQPSRMYAYGMGYGGIWRTDDGGQTWIDKTSNLPNVGFEYTVQSAAIDPGDDSTVWIGLKYTGVFASRDGGDTWTDESNGIYLGESNWGPQCISLALTANGEHAMVCQPYGFVYFREPVQRVFLPFVTNGSSSTTTSTLSGQSAKSNRGSQPPPPPFRR